jgi:hypothetical protein
VSDEPGDWPAGVRPIGVDDLRRLGISADHQLFWDGRRIEVRRAFVLTGFQKGLAAAVTVAAILGGLGGAVTGLNNASVFLCGRGVTWLGCPVPPRR